MCIEAWFNNHRIHYRTHIEWHFARVIHQLVDRHAVAEPLVFWQACDIEANTAQRRPAAIHFDTDAAEWSCHRAVDVHIELKLTTTLVAVDIHRLAICRKNNGITRVGCRNINHVAAALDRNFGNHHRLVWTRPANAESQITSDFRARNNPRKRIAAICIERSAVNVRRRSVRGVQRTVSINVTTSAVLTTGLTLINADVVNRHFTRHSRRI